MRFHLRTLMILLAVGPPLLAACLVLAMMSETQLTGLAMYALPPAMFLAPLIAAIGFVWWLRRRNERRFHSNT